MKALLRKELRENLVVALLGLLVMSALVVIDCRFCLIARLDNSDPIAGPPFQIVQPLLVPDYQVGVHFVCAILGAVFGWMQVHRERHRDLWAFLIHRPVTRTQVFHAKSAAGLALYLLAAGLPLAGLAVWSAMPGNVSVPFYWAMTLPAVAGLLAGVVYYFAGMVIALRQARWYASRALVIAVPVGVSFAVMQFPEFWQAALTAAAGLLILVPAAWGAWQTGGVYKNQPLLGRAALTLALLSATFPLTMAAGALLVALLRSPSEHDSPGSRYWIGVDSSVSIVSMLGARTQTVTDLDGSPVKDPRIRAARNLGELRRLFPEARAAWLNLPNHAEPHAPFRARGNYRGGNGRFYKLLPDASRAAPGALWYYDAPAGRLTAYDTAARRLAGTLGPGGFSPGPATPAGGSRFDFLYGGNFGLPNYAVSGPSIYQVDFVKREVVRIFAGEKDDPIVNANNFFGSGFDHTKSEQTFVATKKAALLLDPEGRLLWKVAIPPPLPDALVLSLLEPRGQYILSVLPPWEQRNPSLPTRLLWIADGRGVVKERDLPPLPQPFVTDDFGSRLMSFLGPPAMLAALRVIVGPAIAREIPLWMVATSLLVALACASAGWRQAQRHRLSPGSRVGWFLFVLVCGIPGLLAFLSVVEWPALEKCADCGQPCPVDHENCPRCGVRFPASRPDGTELFEPLQTP
jgi:hypothetical protein